MHINTLFRKSLAIIIIFLFSGIALSPVIADHSIRNYTHIDDIPQNTKEQFYEVTCKIFSTDIIDEIKKNVSLNDLYVLNVLYQNNIEAFVEKLSELDLLGNQTTEETLNLIYEKSENKIYYFSDNTTNTNCNFKFTGDIFQIFYLPVPYFALQLFLKFGGFIIAPIAIILLILLFKYPELLEKIGNFINKILTPFESVIKRLIKFTSNMAQLIGWIHCWIPIKFPFRNTIITSGSLYLETSGDFGTWNRTATMSLTIMGFCGLWISLPPLSIPPYTPTWCVGHARLIVSK
jgi:hypothetical protein